MDFAKGFTNHEQTDPSGLIYMQARFFAPWFGRFLSPDPALDQHFQDTQSWNIYSYCENQPTMKVDPTGMVIDDFYFNSNGDMVDRVAGSGTRVFVEQSGGSVSHGGRTFGQVDAGFFNTFVPAVVGEAGGSGFAENLDIGKATQNAMGRFGRSADGDWYGGKLQQYARIDAIESENAPYSQAAGLVGSDQGIEQLRTGDFCDAFQGAMASLSNMTADPTKGAPFWVSNRLYDSQMKKLDNKQKVGKGYSAAREEKAGELTKTHRDGAHTFHKEAARKKSSGSEMKHHHKKKEKKD